MEKQNDTRCYLQDNRLFAMLLLHGIQTSLHEEMNITTMMARIIHSAEGTYVSNFTLGIDRGKIMNNWCFYIGSV